MGALGFEAMACPAALGRLRCRLMGLAVCAAVAGVALCGAEAVAAGSGEARWLKRYSVLTGSASLTATGIAGTRDGGAVVVGTRTSSDGQSDLWIARLDGDGNTQWQRVVVSEPGRATRGLAVAETADGGLLVAGIAESLLLARVEADGRLSWARTYGNPGWFPFSFAFAAGPTGGAVLAGSMYRYGTSDTFDALVVSVDSSGAILWQKAFGGSGFDGITTTADGAVVAAGWTGYGQSATEACGWNLVGCADAWVVRFDGSGTVTWSRALGGPRGDFANALLQKDDGAFVIAGASTSFDPLPSGPFEGSCGFLDTGCYDAWVFELGGGGDLRRQVAYDAGEASFVRAIVAPPGGDELVVGGSDGRAFAIRSTAPDVITWQRSYRGGVWGYGSLALAATPSGRLLAATEQVGDDGYSGDSAIVLKPSGQGEIPGCPAVFKSGVTATLTTVPVRDAPVPTIDTLAVSAPITVALAPPAQVFEDAACWSCGKLDFAPTAIGPDVSRALAWCLSWPSGVGTGTPQRCSASGCLNCAYGLVPSAGTKVPPGLIDLYREVALLPLRAPGPRPLPAGLGAAVTILRSLNTGPRLQSVLDESVPKQLPGRRPSPLAWQWLARAVNAAEVDLAAPAPARVSVKAGASATVRLGEGLVVRLRGIEQAGELSLRVRDGLPAPLGRIVAAWPVMSLDVAFTGKLAPKGNAELAFFVGGLPRGSGALRVLAWTGSHYQDVTLGEDRRQHVLRARVERLGVFVLAGASDVVDLFGDLQTQHCETAEP